MEFYDLSKPGREQMVQKIEKEIAHALKTGKSAKLERYASDSDTYIRKNIYLILGRLYRDQQDVRIKILETITSLLHNNDEKARQTAVYSLGEIGKVDAGNVEKLLEEALEDNHHSVRNAVIGALKQMGEKNPEPVLDFARKFLHHPDPKIRREVIHGMELRGRTHPEEILPLLKELENDPDRKIREMVVHVIGQISYKEGCLEKVVSALGTWHNQELINQAVAEIMSVHRRYKRFSAKSRKEAKQYINDQMNPAKRLNK